MAIVATNCTLSGLCVEIGEMCADFARPSERDGGLWVVELWRSRAGVRVLESRVYASHETHTAETPASTALSPWVACDVPGPQGPSLRRVRHTRAPTASWAHTGFLH